MFCLKCPLLRTVFLAAYVIVVVAVVKREIGIPKELPGFNYLYAKFVCALA